jgi:hypothetical protein
MRVVPKPQGAWLVDGEIVLSEILRRPGPTQSLFDVLACALDVVSVGLRVAVLGFAGGGIVGPLRALGSNKKILGVDLDSRGFDVFRRLSGEWAGDVEYDEAEACAWLRSQRRPFDVILEDLSEPHPTWQATKPAASYCVLPELMASKLRPDGAVVVNLLPWPETSWKALVSRIASPFARATLVHFEEFDNRALIAGNHLPSTRELSRSVRASLTRLGSNQRDRISFRSVDRAR